MSRYSAILFDLDGTIADSAPGITATLAYTFERLGMPIPPPADLLKWVGPPIMDSFRDLAGMTREESEAALDIYRARYLDQGAYDATAYEGVGQIIRRVSKAGVPMSLATSKPEKPATLILEHFGLARFFDEITGASEDEVRSAKADVIEEALRRLRARGADLSNTIMIGDREHDVHGATANGIPTIFVRWGYGSPAEEVGSIAAVDTPDQLEEQLFGAEESAA